MPFGKDGSGGFGVDSALAKATRIGTVMLGEQEPRSSDSRMPALVDVIPHIVWEARPGTDSIDFNQRWYEYTGLTPESSRGDGWSLAIHPEDRQSYIDRWRQTARTGQLFEIEYRLRDNQGRYRWFLDRAAPQHSQEGMIVAWVGISTDVDDQRKIERDLKRDEERFRLLAGAIPQVVWTTDCRGAVNYLNRQWFDFTGLSEEESRGEWWPKVVHPDDREKSRAHWALALEQGNFPDLEQRLLRAADKSYRWHLVRGAALRDELGAIVQWVGTMTDVEDQRREATLLEQLVRDRTADLERSNRHLEEFAAVASHDLQEPLRKIQAFGARLQQKYSHALGNLGTEYVERILRSAARMRALINDLLAFSRITTEKQALVLVDLAAVAFEVVADLEELIRETGGKVDIGLLPTVRGDRLQIRQLLQNLIANGLKFHQPGTSPVVRLTARTVREPGMISDNSCTAWHELSVEDDGIGFEEIYLDRIFQVFQRLRGRSEYEGSGMGLAICRKIVERHMGRITARSTPGQGSTFIVTLPAELDGGEVNGSTDCY